MKVITISREFGAGGHSIGRELAKRLGVEFYDQDIIKQAAKASGIDVSELKEEEETITKGQAFARAISPSAFDLKDTIYNYESEAIINLAKKGPCVILGRCASAVLEDAGIDAIHVFLHADQKARLPRAAQLLGMEDNLEDALKALRRIDVGRKTYFEFYSGRKWGQLSNYTLVLDTGVLGPQACIDIIARAAQD